MSKCKGRVLIVDDETDLLEALEAFLRPHFEEVETAINGKIALTRHQQRAFDVIISDLRMPVMTGQQLLQELRQAGDETPFIILTGFADLDATVLALRLGAFDFFTKPFNDASIIAKTREAFRMRQLMLQADNDVRDMIKRGELASDLPPATLTAAKHLAYLRRINESRRET